MKSLDMPEERFPVLGRMWLIFCVMPLAVTGASSSVCGDNPDTFLAVGSNSHTIPSGSDTEQIQLNAVRMPFHVFDINGAVTGTIWHRQGSVELTTYGKTSGSIYVHIVNSDWSLLDNLTGTVYYRHTSDAVDMEKINSYICDDFVAEQALINTFDCLREGDEESFPKARYQIILASGKNSNDEDKSYLMIATGVLPGDAWDNLVTTPYRYYLRHDSYYYPIPVRANSLLAIDVTHKQDFTPDVEPDLASCRTSVICVITRSGMSTTFSGDESTLSSEKHVMAEWNPGYDECKFKFLANFKNGYQWSFFNVGPHTNAKKFFRVIDFDRYDGKVSKRGWKCTGSCRGVITDFPYEIEDSINHVTYATVNEVDPGNNYTIDTTLCADMSDPYYKFTYHFGASDTEPLATLEIDQDFYYANKDQMTGLCVDD